MADNPAPPPSGHQGQSWCSGAKDVVTRALNGNVWATVGSGIVNEVFWPAPDQPQVKDFGFLIRSEARSQWLEVKLGDSSVELSDDRAVPLATITHRGDFYVLTLEVVPDPQHDALLIGYQLTGSQLDPDQSQSLQLYPLLAPHLGTYSGSSKDETGMDNVAWVDGDALYARDGANQHVLCLLSDQDFARSSVGFVGSSDGWTDLFRNGTMTWEYTSAGPGVVALMGELIAATGETSGALALGFGNTPVDARAAAQGGLDHGLAAAKSQVSDEWTGWAAGLSFPDTAKLDPDLGAAVRQSATVLRINHDATGTGAIIAGPATPWGDQSNDAGGYHMVWGRDSCETALALAALGDLDTGMRLLSFLAAHQCQNPALDQFGSWERCYFFDGSSRPGLQLDEIAFPVLLAAKLAELGGQLTDDIDEMMRRAVTFLVRNGPAHGDDRWEETQGTSPFDLALILVALIAGAQLLFDGAEKSYALALADDWNNRLEQFTYISGGLLDRAFGTAGHYVRIGGPTDQVRLGNQPQETQVRAELMVGMEFLYLARLGLRDPRDQRIVDTVEVVDRMLTRTTNSGTSFCRYDMDGYGEWLDGSGWPVRGYGIGRPWPLLSGERGHYDLLVGNDVRPWIAAMLLSRGRGGLIPEQIWDAEDLPWRNLINGKPTGSAMPLAWAHSELIKLAVTATSPQRRPFERLQVVDDYLSDHQPGAASCWHWRTTGPVLSLPSGRSLAIEEARPFTLHYGFDEWQPATIAEQQAQLTAFGLYGVTFTPDQLAGCASLQFVRRYDDGAWDPAPYSVVLGVKDSWERSLPLPARETAGRPPHRTGGA